MPKSSLIKFADDITAVCLITNNDESDYRNEIEQLVMWNNDNSLILHVDETKEIIVDFRTC